MEEKISFSYQTKVKDMYRFFLYHAYIGISGVINLLISVGAIVLLITGGKQRDAFGNVILIILALLFTVINPIQLYYKAAKQVKLTPMFQQPLNYEISKDGIKVTLGEEEMALPFSEVRKIVETGKDFYFYMTLTRAHVLPKEGFSEDVNMMRTLINEYATDSIKRIKKVEQK